MAKNIEPAGPQSEKAKEVQEQRKLQREYDLILDEQNRKDGENDS